MKGDGKMIKTFKLNNMHKCTKLISTLNSGFNKVRYYPTDEEGIKQRLLRRFESDNVTILLQFNNNEVVGVLELLIEPNDNYLQILAVFVDGNINEGLNAYFEYINNEYKNHKLMYVLSDFNIDYIKYMESIKAKSDGYETMITIVPKDFIESSSSNVVKLDKTYHNQFKALHNHLYPDVYWTAELLVTSEAPFNIDVVIKNDKLVGYSVISYKNRLEEEIYFLYSKAIDYKLSLLNKSISCAFDKAQEVILLLDTEEVNDIDYYKRVGFKEKEKIITYKYLT